MRKDAPDTRSKLHANMLTAFGTHRYYSSDIADTCTMVDRLAEDSDPFFAIEAIYPAGFETTRHSHDRGQVTFVRDGMMSLVTDDQTLIVPARHAVWVPAHMSHQPLAQGHVCVMSAYAARECWGDLPGTCQVFQASDMLEPLIKRVIACQLTRDDGPIHDALLLLLHQEVIRSPKLATGTPMPSDPRLRRVCERVLRCPMMAQNKEEMARYGNMSSRTMTRLFRSEFNVTYSEWVQQALILSAIGLLVRGFPVSHVAYELGYTSPSAFTAMFKRRIGQSPSNFARPH